MLASPDFKDLLKLFTRHKVRYLIVGGYAVMKYSEPRFTKDLDLLVSTKPENAQAIYLALHEFGAPLKGLKPEDFMADGHFYQMGQPPMRVDIMMSIPGVDFDKAWPRRETVEINGLTMDFIGKEDLMCAKKASGRPQDLLDLENLKKS